MSINFNIPYSAQYNATNREGHEHPPPTFGTPTLVWHLAISPHWQEIERKFDAPLGLVHEMLAQRYEDTRAAFYLEVNQLLEALQSAAGFPAGPAQTFDAQHLPAPWEKWESLGNPFFITSPGSIRFTLWWSDRNTRPEPEPGPDALRIKVSAAAHRDYVTLSFYLDAAKPWNAPAQRSSDQIVGQRRKSIMAEVDRVRQICQARMAPDQLGNRAIDREIVPEHGVSAEDAAALLRASRYLYSDVWEEFCEVVGGNQFAALRTCRVFANFRGLIVSTSGLPETAEERPFPGASGGEPFPRFAGRGGVAADGTSSAEPNEANAVVKAFWPFIRRTIRDADRKEFVACGVMAWRALYVTTLNCPPSFEWQEEARGAEAEIPSGQLPDAFDFPAAGPEGQVPVHYLLITKGEPHRLQIGRITERINSMGTMRLIALRDYSIIRDASTQIQLRGLELDKMMRRWSMERLAIKAKFDEERSGRVRSETEIKDDEDKALQLLADNVERDLIGLSAALDEIGSRAAHGLPFRINRSRYYVEEFMSLLESLAIGNIDTWVAYDQFVKRGLKPSFDFIDGVGERLVGLRTRLQTVLEAIETGALVTQTAATRQNTMALRQIAGSFYKANFWLRVMSLMLTILSVSTALLGLQGILRGLMQWFRP